MMNNILDNLNRKSFDYPCGKFYQVCYSTQYSKENYTKGIMLNYCYYGIDLLTEDGALRVRMGDIKEIIPIKNLSSKIDSFQEIINDFKKYNENYKTEDNNVENTSAAAQKNGYWIKDENIMYCNKCHSVFDSDLSYYLYCPVCGSKNKIKGE